MKEQSGLVFLICIGLKNVSAFAILSKVKQSPCQVQGICCSIRFLKVMEVKRLATSLPLGHDFVGRISQQDSINVIKAASYIPKKQIITHRMILKLLLLLCM